jgi:Fur family peroxide stress response transcriptional regulator
MVKHELNKQNLHRFKQICDEVGIKVTHQRLEIFKELLAASDHPSAEVIHDRLQERMPTIAIDTVYRTLTTFDELGIVKKLHVANERTLFDTNLKTHHHFICIQCRKVNDIYWPDFDKSSLPDNIGHLGKVNARHLELHGVCIECLKAENAKS